MMNNGMKRRKTLINDNMKYFDCLFKKMNQNGSHHIAREENDLELVRHEYLSIS